MMEKKFRAWDKKRKEWYGASNPLMLAYYDFHIFGECTLLCTPAVDDLRNLEITQWTGLKDKNGNPIYEGDIVTGDRKGTLDTVIFAHGCFCLENAMMHYEATYWGDEIEVKGNIYENPELLK